MPVGTVQRQLGECSEFFLARTLWQDLELHSRRLFVALAELACREDDADRLLHSLEDARRHVWLVALGRAIDHPDFRAGAPQVIAHFFETRTVEKPGDRNETDDAFLVLVRVAGCRVVAGPKTFHVAQRQK